jgi:hypothetical protein
VQALEVGFGVGAAVSRGTGHGSRTGEAVGVGTGAAVGIGQGTAGFREERKVVEGNFRMAATGGLGVGEAVGAAVHVQKAVIGFGAGTTVGFGVGATLVSDWL